MSLKYYPSPRTCFFQHLWNCFNYFWKLPFMTFSIIPFRGTWSDAPSGIPSSVERGESSTAKVHEVVEGEWQYHSWVSTSSNPFDVTLSCRITQSLDTNISGCIRQIAYHKQVNTWFISLTVLSSGIISGSMIPCQSRKTSIAPFNWHCRNFMTLSIVNMEDCNFLLRLDRKCQVSLLLTIFWRKSWLLFVTLKSSPLILRGCYIVPMSALFIQHIGSCYVSSHA